MKNLIKNFIATTLIASSLVFVTAACSPLFEGKAPTQDQGGQSFPKTGPSFVQSPTKKEKLQKIKFDPDQEPSYQFKEINFTSNINPSLFLDEWSDGDFLTAVTPDEINDFQGDKVGFPEKLDAVSLASYNISDDSLTYLERVYFPQNFIRLAWGDQEQLIWIEVADPGKVETLSWKLMVKNLKDNSIHELLGIDYKGLSKDAPLPFDLFPESMVVLDDKVFLIYPTYEDQTWYSCISYTDIKNGKETIIEKLKVDDGFHAQLSLEKEEGRTVLWNRLSEFDPNPNARTSYKICAICSFDLNDKNEYKTIANDGYYLSPLKYGDCYFAIEIFPKSSSPEPTNEVISEFKDGEKSVLIRHELSTEDEHDTHFSLFGLRGNKRFMGVQQSGGLPILYEPSTGKLVEISDIEVGPKQAYQLVDIFDHYAIFYFTSPELEEPVSYIVHLPQ